jgi:hypothetical protein
MARCTQKRGIPIRGGDNADVTVANTLPYSAPRWLSGRRRPPAEHRADLGSFAADPSRSSRAIEHAYNVAGIDSASSDDVASTCGNPICLLGAFQHLPRHAWREYYFQVNTKSHALSTHRSVARFREDAS